MKKRHTDSVFRHLESGYDLEGSGQDYPARLLAVVTAAVEDKLPEMQEQARQAMEGSFYDELDEDNQTVLLKTALVNSTAYTVFARMGVDPELYLDSDDFSHMWNFNTPELLAVLGTGVNDIAAPLLREVEQEVKRIDREKSRPALAKKDEREYNEFSDLKREAERSTGHGQQSGVHHQGGLSVSQPDNGGAGAG